MEGAAGDLLERGDELRRCSELLRSARGGSGGLVMLDGAAGLGKSSLLGAVDVLARDEEMVVLRARGEQLERKRPWSLVRQLFGSVLASIDPAATGSGDEAAAAARTMLQTSPSDGLMPSFTDPLPLIHSLFWLTADLAAEAPLAILIDDAHWADEESLRFVRYLVPRLEDLATAVVLACRPREPDAGRVELEWIATSPRVSLLELAPLTNAAVDLLVHRYLCEAADRDLVDACAEVTGGNPFYLHELIRDLRRSQESGEQLSSASVRSSTPSSVVRATFLRLTHLGPAAVALARAVSVLGERAAFPHAAELARLDHMAASKAFDVLAAAQILADGEPLRFGHPLVAASVHDQISAGKRRDLHLEAARLLDRDGAPPEAVASQLLLGGHRADAWVVTTLRTAARRAIAEGATRTAVEYLERALAEPPEPSERAELLAELGRAEAAVGRPEAPERFSAALALTDDPTRRAELLLARGRALALQGRHPEAAGAFEEGLRGLVNHGGELGRELRTAWWMSARLSPTAIDPPGGLEPSVEPGLEPFDGGDAPTPGQRQLLAQLAMQRVFEGARSDELIALAERAWGDGALLESESSDGLTWSLVAGALLVADALERELEVCELAMGDARRRGSPMAFATVSYTRAFPLLYQGRVAQAIADAQAAVDARDDGWSTFAGAAAACLAMCHIEIGLLDDARAALGMVEHDPGIQASLQYMLVLVAKGRLRLAERNAQEALEILLQVGEMADAAGIQLTGVYPWQAEAAIAASIAGAREVAHDLSTEALDFALASGSARDIAHARRACGYATTGDDAIGHFAAAVETLSGGPPRLQLAYALVDLGAALRRTHRRAAARERLLGGLRFADAAGATALAERARIELAAAGARSVPHTRSGINALTPSERRVAELAAAGHTNRAVAQMLFVTVKAVEYHLANTYRKLDIAGRAELRPLLSDGANAPGALTPSSAESRSFENALVQADGVTRRSVP